MLDTVKINHVQHISFTQSRLTDAVSVILSELLSYEHPSKARRFFGAPAGISPAGDKLRLPGSDQKKSPRQKARRFFGAPAGIRTPDTLLKRQVLCLLSYWGISV